MDTRATRRPRRSDAQRSIDAIVSAARSLLRDRPDASIEEIAAAAGVTRQTVYAHFSSRDRLVAEIVNAERAEGLAAVEAASLDAMPPVEALRRFLQISWEIVDRCPLALEPVYAKTPGPDGGDAHQMVAHHLERIVRRGQRSGDFDRAMPADWLTEAIFGLGHTAAEQAAAGRHAIHEAARLLESSALRLLGATAEPRPPRKTLDELSKLK